MGCPCSRGATNNVIEAKVTPLNPKEADSKQNSQQAADSKTKETRFNAKDVIGKRTTDFHRDYEYLDDIGRGTYGEVVRARHRKTKIERAVKIIELKSLSESEKNDIFKEIEILRQLDYPGIMNIYEYYESPDYIFIIGELYTGGELIDKLAGTTHVTEKEAAYYISQILAAVNYCHQHKIVHRDLKPTNILFDNPSATADLKVIDFGVSAAIEPNTNLTKTVGTPFYMAPEVFQMNYNEKCDIWSIGVITYMLLIGAHPFKGPTKQDTAQLISDAKYPQTGPAWEGLSQDAKNFIARTLEKDPKKRLSAEEALKDPWIVSATHEKVNHQIISSHALENIRTFRAQKKLQEAFYVYICSHFSLKEEKEKYLATFKALDKNNDGTLSKEELLNGCHPHFASKYSDEDIKYILDNADLNGNGVVDYSEFVIMSINRKKVLQEQRLSMAFEIFDKNHDGVLTLDEIKELFNPSDKHIQDEDWKKLIKEIDENRDGKIGYREFKDAMLNILRNKK